MRAAARGFAGSVRDERCLLVLLGHETNIPEMNCEIIEWGEVMKMRKSSLCLFWQKEELMARQMKYSDQRTDYSLLKYVECKRVEHNGVCQGRGRRSCVLSLLCRRQKPPWKSEILPWWVFFPIETELAALIRGYGELLFTQKPCGRAHMELGQMGSYNKYSDYT